MRSAFLLRWGSYTHHCRLGKASDTRQKRALKPTAHRFTPFRGNTWFNPETTANRPKKQERSCNKHKEVHLDYNPTKEENTEDLSSYPVIPVTFGSKSIRTRIRVNYLEKLGKVPITPKTPKNCSPNQAVNLTSDCVKCRIHTRNKSTLILTASCGEK